MKLLLTKAALFLVPLFLMGCASLPREKMPSNYLELGMSNPKLIGSSFYMATGQVDLYHYVLFAGYKKTGERADIAVAIQANPATGEILRMSSMLSGDEQGMDYGRVYKVRDLEGGFYLTDVEPHDKWIEAVDSMQKAMEKFNPFLRTGGNPYPRDTVIFVGPRYYPVWGWGYRHRFY